MIYDRKTTDVNTLLGIRPPEETDTYKPVSYKDILNIAKSYEVIGEPVIYNGRTPSAYKMVFPTTFEDTDLKGIIEINNSYNKSVAYSIKTGVSVKVCSNGMFVETLNSYYYNKHYNNDTFNPFGELIERIGTLKDMFESHIKIKTLLSTEIIYKDQMKLDLLKAVLYDKFFMSREQYKFINEQIDNPRYNYHNGQTKWDYYNHCTLATRNVDVFKSQTSHKRLSAHFLDVN